jgi:DNA-binding beta-propeller fold protein YncE
VTNQLSRDGASLLAFFLVGFSQLVAAGQARRQFSTTTINVGGGPVAVSPGTNKVYFGKLGSNDCTVIDVEVTTITGLTSLVNSFKLPLGQQTAPWPSWGMCKLALLVEIRPRPATN